MSSSIAAKGNTAHVRIGTLVLHYSYETLVGFETPSTGLVLTKNRWGAATGKLLNSLDGGKSERLDGDVFDAVVEALTNGVSNGLTGADLPAIITYEEMRANLDAATKRTETSK